MNTHQQQALSKLLLTMFLLILLAANSSVGVVAAPRLQEEPIYIVQSGDSLGSIALRFGITADDIQSANGIADPNTLDIGQQLVIPGLKGISGVLTSEVLPFGISLVGLTRQYGLIQHDLVYLNRITSPSETIAGIKFIIPITEGKDPFAPIATLNQGETVLEAAIRLGTSPWTLVENNQLDATWDLLPGETLFGNIDTSTSPAILPGVAEISLNNLPIIQGETLQVTLSATTPVEFSGSFNNEPLHFFSDDGEKYYSFHGIHALAEPGTYPLEITATYSDGTSYSFEQLVLLSAGGYGFQSVTVGEDYLDQSVIDEEDSYLQPVLKQNTPTRHWEGRFQYPVDEPCINYDFGLRRDYNNGGLFFYHTGTDFRVCAQNLNIFAPAAGEVVLAEELTIRGKAILIDHGWGVFSGYWHLSEYNVEVGDFVQPGDLLGLIGDSGRSAGPHLHFEIDITGTPVNPHTWLTQAFP